ncbi:MAG: hypothetical protein ACKVTZ_20530 [Bacteroidia bacterium]
MNSSIIKQWFSVDYKKILFGFYLFTLLLLLAIHATNQNTTFAYIDEATYLENVHIIEKYGFSAEMIRHYIGPPGPLYGTIHYVTRGFTQNIAAYTRFTTFFLFLLLIWKTKKLISIFEFQSHFLISLSILAIPITYMCAGMSLTEVPAMLCVVMAVTILLKNIDNQGNVRYLQMLFAGFLMGLAILGRQNFLVILAGFPLLLWQKWEVKRVFALFLFFLATLPLPLVVFSIWGGMIPSMNYEANQGVVVFHGFLAFQYAAIFTLMLAPSWFYPPNFKIIVIGMISFLLLLFLNYQFSFFQFLPIKILTEKITSEKIKLLLSSTFVATAILSTVYFVFSTYFHLQKNKENTSYIVLTACFYLLTASCASVSHMFGSRYVWLGMPFLLVMIGKEIRWNVWVLATSLLGIGVGIYSLLQWIHYF